MIRVLLIDDDRRLFELLGSYLGQNGCDVAHAPDGPAGLSTLTGAVFDVVLLDMMMPGIDGLETLRRLRRTHPGLPVIMLTAKGDETDRVVGLELGADDYVGKPFGPRELLARIRAVLRRAQPAAVAERIEVRGVMVDLGARSVEIEGQAIDLTGLEFDLLAALMKRAGRVVPREDLLAAAGRGDIHVSERTVDVHVSHLRGKLKDPALIKTVRGIGYVFPRDEDA